MSGCPKPTRCPPASASNPNPSNSHLKSSRNGKNPKSKTYPVCWKNPVTGELHVQVHPCGAMELEIEPIASHANGVKGGEGGGQGAVGGGWESDGFEGG